MNAFLDTVLNIRPLEVQIDSATDSSRESLKDDGVADASDQEKQTIILTKNTGNSKAEISANIEMADFQGKNKEIMLIDEGLNAMTDGELNQRDVAYSTARSLLTTKNGDVFQIKPS